MVWRQDVCVQLMFFNEVWGLGRLRPVPLCTIIPFFEEYSIQACAPSMRKNPNILGDATGLIIIDPVTKKVLRPIARGWSVLKRPDTAYSQQHAFPLQKLILQSHIYFVGTLSLLLYTMTSPPGTHSIHLLSPEYHISFCFSVRYASKSNLGSEGSVMTVKKIC